MSLRVSRGILGIALVLVSLTANAAQGQITLAENTFNPALRNGGDNLFSYGHTIGAEDFSLASTYSITSISHLSFHTPSQVQPTSIDWFLYDNNGTTPGAVLFSGNSTTYTTAVEQFVGQYDITRYSIALSGITLGPGDYWVGFHNNTEAGYVDPHWAFASGGTSIDNRNAISTNDGLTWSNHYSGGDDDMAFRVEGAVVATPEPASLALLATGLVGIAAALRRKRARVA